LSLPELSIRQGVLVNVLFVGVLLGGFFAWQRIPVEVFPDISFNTAILTTVWSGAYPDEVERLVTTKLEEEIEDVDGIKKLTSVSQADVSIIEVEWDESLSEIGYQGALGDLRAAVDRVNDLPGDAEEPVLRELSVGEVRNACMIAVADVGGVGEATLRRVARDLEDRIERLPGVRRVVLRGERDRELRVLVDRDRAFQYDLTLPEISAWIGRNNQNIPAGSFTDGADREITVRGLGNYVTREELADTVVKKDEEGVPLRLEEVAQVVPGFETRRVAGRYNGHPAILVGVAQQSGTDMRRLVARVRSLIRDREPFLPPGVETTLTWDQSRYIDSRMALMESNLWVGVGAVVGVLWLTVGLRNALLAILAVPFSFLFAFFVFPTFGMSLNSLTLVGFIMVSGMLVDHAIIIIENIYRHLEEGQELRTAIVEGTAQVMWPVIATVATTLAAFIPMLGVSGTSGEFFSLLPKAVILTLLGSLLEALVVLPAHYLDWGNRRTGAGAAARGGLGNPAGRRLRAGVDRAMNAARRTYLRALDPVLAHRGPFLLACLAALFCTCGLSRHVRVDLFPSDFNQLFVTLDAPVDSGIDRTSRAMRPLELALAGLGPDITDTISYAGMKMSPDGAPTRGVNYGVIYVQFPDTPENVADPQAVLEHVKSTVLGAAAQEPSELERVLVFAPRNGPPVGKPVAIRVATEDWARAKQVAAVLKAELATIPGVYNIEDNLPLGPRELQIHLEEERASLHGLGFQDLGLALRAANDGLVPSTFKDPRSEEDVDIRVLLQDTQRRRVKDLLDVELRTPEGHRVPLRDVARVDLVRSYQSLHHFDGERTVTVYASVDGKTATSVSVNREMAARFADAEKRWPGVRLHFGGEFQVANESLREMGQAFLLAVLAIYAILAAQFRSALQPLVVMSVIGFAFIGVILGMWVFDYALSMSVLYAVVGLAGVVVNDSLVLLDFVNQQSGRLPHGLAVRQACATRFRPILLTTVTTIAGLLPMALGVGGKHPIYGPFAAAIVFGLGVSTGLTLFLVPALELFLAGLRDRLRPLRVARLRSPGQVPS